jgi:hypothetical protein
MKEIIVLDEEDEDIEIHGSGFDEKEEREKG